MRAYLLVLAFFPVWRCDALAFNRNPQIPGAQDLARTYTRSSSYDEVNFDQMYIHEPNVTLLEDIPESAIPDHISNPLCLWGSAEMCQFKLKDWPVSVMIYSHPGHTDTAHSFQIAKTGSFDAETVMALCQEYKRYGAKGAILDVGANIGSYALPLASCLKDAGNGNSLIAIEANSANNAHLRAGIKYNNLDNIHLYEYAVGPEQDADTVAMKEKMHNHGMPHVVGNSHPPTEKGGVLVTTIDAIWAEEDISRKRKGLPSEGIFAMKMDIEGFEFQALQGAQQLLQLHAPCVINLEITRTPEKTAPILESAGYVRKAHPDTHNKVDGWYERSDMKQCVDALGTSQP